MIQSAASIGLPRAAEIELRKPVFAFGRYRGNVFRCLVIILVVVIVQFARSVQADAATPVEPVRAGLKSPGAPRGCVIELPATPFSV